jgi:hypothetical protein
MPPSNPAVALVRGRGQGAPLPHVEGEVAPSMVTAATRSYGEVSAMVMVWAKATPSRRGTIVTVPGAVPAV